jgi:hypothetical protein
MNEPLQIATFNVPEQSQQQNNLVHGEKHFKFNGHMKLAAAAMPPHLI